MEPTCQALRGNTLRLSDSYSVFSHGCERDLCASLYILGSFWNEQLFHWMEQDLLRQGRWVDVCLPCRRSQSERHTLAETAV